MMKIRQIKIILTLSACIIVGVFSILQKYSIKELSYTLVIVAILFYMIGALIQGFLNRGMKRQIVEKKAISGDMTNDDQKDVENTPIEKN